MHRKNRFGPESDLDEQQIEEDGSKINSATFYQSQTVIDSVAHDLRPDQTCKSLIDLMVSDHESLSVTRITV